MFSIPPPPSKHRSSQRERQPPAAEVEEDNAKVKALAEFREVQAKMQARAEDMDDMRFWVCLVFQSEQQKLEFLDQLNGCGIMCIDDTYLDGEAFAQAVDKPVTTIANESKPFKTVVHRKFAELVNREQSTREQDTGFG